MIRDAGHYVHLLLDENLETDPPSTYEFPPEGPARADRRKTGKAWISGQKSRREKAPFKSHRKPGPGLFCYGLWQLPIEVGTPSPSKNNLSDPANISFRHLITRASGFSNELASGWIIFFSRRIFKKTKVLINAQNFRLPVPGSKSNYSQDGIRNLPVQFLRTKI